MYLPEDNAQLFEILSTLRVYAATNHMPKLAEELDDALILLRAETRSARRPGAAGQASQDLR
jgi:hypothetical protein